MPTDKSPGNDRLSKGFYQFFWHDIWHDIKAPLISSFQIAYQTISSSWKKTKNMRLIEKKDKDKRCIQNCSFC